MLYECTDCKHCANFADGFRLYCLAPELPPDEVLKYQPLGNNNAGDCIGFNDGDEPRYFLWDDIARYEDWSIEHFGGVTYESVRAWCEQCK